MSDRERHERQIKAFDTTWGGEFKDALSRVARDLDWFTDEQIADIRAEMIQREVYRRQRARESRQFHAKLRAAS